MSCINCLNNAIKYLDENVKEIMSWLSALRNSSERCFDVKLEQRWVIIMLGFELYLSYLKNTAKPKKQS